jgi:predicted Zn finger-like uncharacterized protein
LAEGIRRRGFRKWYERELLTGHAHLALVLMCTLGLMMSLEAAMRGQPMHERLLDLLAVALCFGCGLWALRRYLYLLTHAEAVAHQADCPQCEAYGRFELLRSDSTGNEVIVRCRQCSHEWGIDG